MEKNQILIIILLCFEIAFIITFIAVYIFRSQRRAKYENENRKLAIKEILEGSKLICEDNLRILSENMQLKLENSILNAKIKELKQKNDTTGTLYDSNGDKIKAIIANRQPNKSKINKKVATKKSVGRKKRSTDTLAN